MPSLSKIKQLFIYNEASGKLVRRVNAPPKGRAGDVIDNTMVSVGGKQRHVAKIVWFINTEQYPTKEIVFRDGDITNTKFSNLELKVD